MKHKLSSWLVTITLLTLTATHVKAQGNIWVNGDFETGSFNGDWNVLGYTPGTHVSVNGNDVESGSYAADIFLPPAQTNPFLASQFQFGGSLLPTTVGQTYLLTFWYAVNFGTVPTQNVEFDARWNLDWLFQSITQNSWGQAGTTYTEVSALVTGSNGDGIGGDDLIFSMQNDGSSAVDVYLDNVLLVATPEPPNSVLLALGCVMFLLYYTTRPKVKELPPPEKQA